MKLSSMQLVGSTVRTDQSCQIAEKILECWGYDDGSDRTVRFSTNFVFVFRQQGIKRFLRFSPAWERRVEQIRTETQLLMTLGNKGFQLAQPVESKTGNLVETVETELGAFHAVVFTAVIGKRLEIGDLSESQFREWGSALGRLRTASQDCGVEHLNRPSWKEHLDFVRVNIADDEPYLLRELVSITTWAESLPQSGENFGLIHFDFELDNLCWDGDTIQMLDFDDCAYHWFAADVALALRDLFDNEITVNFEDSRLKAFLKGYRAARPINEEWVKCLPMFLRMRKLLGYVDLKNCIDLSMDQTQDWLKPLHRKLTHMMEQYRLSLKA